jgi:hypothetical protein
MSSLQRIGVYQKTDHWHPALTRSGVMTSDVSEVTETDEDVRIINVLDNVQKHSADTLDFAFVRTPNLIAVVLFCVIALLVIAGGLRWESTHAAFGAAPLCSVNTCFAF